MIDHRNHDRTGHILTIEDPIEYLHAHDKSVIDQREVGTDTNSLSTALQNALRESPDVIVIGEIRDRAAMEGALAFASTGHLCIATLHAVNASQALDSVLRFFPAEARDHVLFELSTHLKAIVSQRLVRAANGGRRLAVFELMLQSTLVSELIAKGDVLRLREAVKQGADEGMLTFEDSLLELYKNGQITLHEALGQADSIADLKLRVRVSEPLTLAPRGTANAAMRLEESEQPDDRAAHADTRLRYGPS
jgi:twitching motility protein PilU